MKVSRYARALLAGSALAVLAAPAWAAAAASTAATEGVRLEEVVITARKAAENLQQTPVAVTAFTSEQLRSEAINNISTIQQRTPSLVVQPNPVSSLGSVIGLRGQLQNDQAPNLDQSVGLYFDGIYVGQTFGSLTDNYIDIERIEILKGPQGTLYGRNTTGGAVNVFTKTPTDRLEGEVMAGYGNYNRREASGVVNVPLGESAALRVVGSLRKDDGYARNRILNERLNDQNTRVLRATLKFDPTPDTEIVLRGDYQRTTSNGFILKPVLLVPGSTSHLELVAERFGAAQLGNAQARTAALQIWNAQVGVDPYVTEYNISGGAETVVKGTSLAVSQNLGSATLKSITAYRKVSNFAEYDLAPVMTRNHASQDTRVKQFSQEIQLTGTTLDERLKYATGLFYYSLKADDLGINKLLPALGAPIFTIATKSKTSSYAVYGQATYSLTNQVRVTGGLRYTKDDKELEAHNTLGPACALPAALVGPTCLLKQSVSAHNLSYTAGVDWSPTQDLLLYAKTGRGFKGGGLPARTTGDPLSAAPFRPEKVTDYEVGLKSEWFDHRLRVNSAYFHSDYTDIQRTVIIPGSNNGPSTTAVRNAAQASIDGVEVEVSAVPVRNLKLGAGLAWVDARYDRFLDGLGNDLSDQKFQNQPKWTYNLNAAYTFELPVGDLTPELDWFWRGSSDQFPGGAAPLALRTEGSYGVLNTRVTLSLQDDSLTISAWSRNLLDQRYEVARFDVVAANGVLTTTPGEPRTYGVTVRKTF